MSEADPRNIEQKPFALCAVQNVTVTEAAVAERPALDQLLQLYLHDFFAYAALDSPYGEVDEQGRFAYPPGLGGYWQEADRTPFLIRANGHLAGFLLMNQWSALDRPLNHAVAEFFIARKYRRARVGTRAAQQVFHRYVGQWEVPVAAYNHDALLFWRAATKGLSRVPVAEHAGDGQRWSGTVLCFDTGYPQGQRT